MTGQHEHHGDPEWDPADDTRFSREFWDERYGASGQIWSGRPNPQLIAEATGLRRGKALDAGCGEGADAIWLAEQGWQVTAVDISTVAIDRGAARAAELSGAVAGRISWQQADLLSWAPRPQGHDLVSAHYMQLPPRHRTAFYDRLAGGVATDGILLLVGHSPADLETTAHRSHHPDLFFTATERAQALDAADWEVLVTDVRPREAKDPDGNSITVYDEVLVARRR